MFQSLSIFQTSSDMAKHASYRQSLVAQNIANADTPQFKAKRADAFSSVYQANIKSSMKASRASHLSSNFSPARIQTYEAKTESAPNGNTVSLEDEMLQSVSISREHSKSIAIYKHALNVLRTVVAR